MRNKDYKLITIWFVCFGLMILFDVLTFKYSKLWSIGSILSIASMMKCYIEMIKD